MNNSFLKFFLLLAFTVTSFHVKSQTLIMNEVSNGPSGSQEYVEFVVVSNTVSYNCSSPTPPCIDIRGWIFDDNSGYHGTSGVAAGAIRFSQNAIWSCIPLVLLVYTYIVNQFCDSVTYYTGVASPLTHRATLQTGSVACRVEKITPT